MGKVVLQGILDEVHDETQKQVARWGIQNHPPEMWIAIISEELGEAAKAVLKRDKLQYRQELCQLAAAAICALYELDVAEYE
jgi:NTP pyrophosphatase (non-canonical NTP hydrolase)